jgi:hypothetical protein
VLLTVAHKKGKHASVFSGIFLDSATLPLRRLAGAMPWQMSLGLLTLCSCSVFDSAIYRSLDAKRPFPQEKATFKDFEMSACESKTL